MVRFYAEVVQNKIVPLEGQIPQGIDLVMPEVEDLNDGTLIEVKMELTSRVKEIKILDVENIKPEALSATRALNETILTDLRNQKKVLFDTECIQEVIDRLSIYNEEYLSALNALNEKFGVIVQLNGNYRKIEKKEIWH